MLYPTPTRLKTIHGAHRDHKQDQTQFSPTRAHKCKFTHYTSKTTIHKTTALNSLHMSPISQTIVLQFRFPEFDNQAGSVLAESSTTDVNGDVWNLMIKLKPLSPKDSHESGNENRHLLYMNFALIREITRSINTDVVKFSFIVRDGKGGVAFEEEFVPSGCLDDANSEDSMRLFTLEGTKVNDNGSVLLDGTLVIDVVIQALSKQAVSEVTHTLVSNPFQRNMINLMHSGENADVTFEFGHFRQCALRAHKLILEANAPALARLFECNDIGTTTSSKVHVRDTSVEAFRFILEYIYGGSPPSQADVLKYGKEIIEAANRYNLSGLKLEIERALVEARVIDVSNCIDFISFAHDNSCLELKKYAISYFVSRSKDVLYNSDHVERLKDSPDLMYETLCSVMKIQPEIDTTKPLARLSKPKKRKGLFRWKRSNDQKKRSTKVVPVQPPSQMKADKNHKEITGMELLVTGKI